MAPARPRRLNNMAARYRKKVCRECDGVYYRRFRRNAGTEGWCGLSCYMKDYRRRPENRGGEAARRRGRGGGARPST